MRFPAFIFFLLCCHFCAFAQKISKLKLLAPRNLVANGSFEDINKCTEFEAMCEPEAWYFLPTYTSEPQGNDSNRYEILAMTNINYGGRSGYYLFSKLLCPLQEGKRYHFSIWINTPQNEFDHLDVYFTHLEPSNHLALNTITEPSFSLIEKYAQAAHRRWKKYSYTYTATGEERFITLGNFGNQPDKTKLTANYKNGDVIYAIDNVSLYPVDNKESPCREYYATTKQLYDQNYRHPARMIDKLPLDSTLLNGNVLEISRNTFIKTDTLIIPDILFQSNSSKINPAFSNKLQEVIVNLRIRHFGAIEIVGHTDSIGSPELNNRLSLQRAATIKEYISMQMQLPETMIEIKGVGALQPKAANDTPEGRKKNRRVEIILKS